MRLNSDAVMSNARLMKSVLYCGCYVAFVQSCVTTLGMLFTLMCLCHQAV